MIPAELTHYEKQAILYFKLHFHITDMIEDLKVFAAEQYALDPKRLELYSVYNFVVKIYSTLVNLKVINISYEKFILSLFDRSDTLEPVGLITKLRAEIQNVRTKDLDLGVADYNLLPKPKGNY